MSVPALDGTAFGVDPVALPENHPGTAHDKQTHSALTARAVVAVTLLGAGLWYLLWRIGFSIVADH